MWKAILRKNTYTATSSQAGREVLPRQHEGRSSAAPTSSKDKKKRQLYVVTVTGPRNSAHLQISTFCTTSAC
jgi:hypothetical protein